MHEVARGCTVYACSLSPIRVPYGRVNIRPDCRQVCQHGLFPRLCDAVDTEPPEMINNCVYLGLSCSPDSHTQLCSRKRR